jgi:hypothetical protein
MYLFMFVVLMCTTYKHTLFAEYQPVFIYVCVCVYVCLFFVCVYLYEDTIFPELQPVFMCVCVYVCFVCMYVSEHTEHTPFAE